MNFLSLCFVSLAIIGSTLAFAGEFVPKSFYVIDKNGHKSDVIYLRTKRASDLLPLIRARRSPKSSSSSSGSQSSASSQSSSSSHSGSGSGAAFFSGFPGADFAFPGLQQLADPAYHAGVLQNLASRSAFPTGGQSGSGSFSGSTSGGNGYGTGYGTGSGTGGSFSAGASGGAPGVTGGVGYDGPILFSRSGEAPGSNIQASSYANGPHASFSSSSTSSENGKVKYSVQSGKY